MPIIALSEDREACHNVCNNSTKLVVSWRWSGLAFFRLLGHAHDLLPPGQMKGGFANAHFQVRQVRMEQGNS